MKMRQTILSLVLLIVASPLWGQDVPPPTVTVETARIAEVRDRIAVSGSLVPREDVEVTPRIAGYPIETLTHDIGDRVNAGDVMATLGDRTLAARLAQAEAELSRARAAVGQAQSQIDSAAASADQATTVLERTRRLQQAGTSTQVVLDSAIAADLTAQAALRTARDGLIVAQAQVQQAEAARDIAALDLSDAVIRAPVAGIVSDRAARVGALSGAGGDPMFRIIKGGTVELEAEVIETALGLISDGDAAELTVAGVGDVRGTVRRVAPTVSRVNRLGIVKVALEGADLRTGLFASGWITVARRDAVTVPSTAVLSDGAGDFVLEVEGDILRRRDIVAGLLWNGRREVSSGLDEGAVVVARAGGFFAGGDRITPVQGGTP
jgi:HlyD family secretion protein